MCATSDFPLAPDRCVHCPFRQRAHDDRIEDYAHEDAREWTRGIDDGKPQHLCHMRQNQKCVGAAGVPQGFEEAATTALAARFSAGRMFDDFPGEGGGGR